MTQFYSFIKDSLNFVTEVSLDFECEATNSFNDFCFQKFNIKKFNGTILNEINEVNSVKLLKKPIYDHAEEIY